MCFCVYIDSIDVNHLDLRGPSWRPKLFFCFLRAQDVNGEDVHGATPLMLAVELMPRSPEYMEMVDCLLEAGAQPRRRSSGGWSPLDEAVARADARLVGTLFKAAQKDG